MKILIITCVFPPEPLVSANLSYDLALSLHELHEVTVLSPRPTRPMGYDFSRVLKPQHPFRHIILPSYTHPQSALVGRFRESYSFGRACMKYIHKYHHKIDIIYLNTWPLFGQYFVIKAARRWNIPTVLHIQDIYPEALIQKLPVPVKSLVSSMLFPVERFITAHSSKIITISPGMRNLLIATRKLPLTKIEVIYNWQDETKFLTEDEQATNIPDKALTHFMFLGSLGPVASIDNLILAFARLKEKDVKLTIAGEGSEKAKLKRLAEDLKESRVHFIEAPASDAGKIQARADVLLLSLKKGSAGLALPSKLPAYMFSARPIIASVDADSDTANVIREAGCGWVAEPDNPFALAQLMQDITMMSKDKLVQMGLKGRAYSLQHFSKQANLSKLVSVVSSIQKLNNDKGYCNLYKW